MAEYFENLAIDLLSGGPILDEDLTSDSDETVNYDEQDYPSDYDFLTLDEIRQSDSEEEQNVLSPTHTTTEPAGQQSSNVTEPDQNSRNSVLSQNFEQLQSMRRQSSRASHANASQQQNYERDLLDIAQASGNAEDSEILPRTRHRARPIVIDSSDDENLPLDVEQISNNNVGDDNQQMLHSPVLSTRIIESMQSQHTDRSRAAEAGSTSNDVQVIVSPPRTRNTQSDFRASQGQGASSVKRKRTSPYNTDSKKAATEPTLILEDSEDDGMSCPICFEPWTNSGSHRLTSLRCGHIFGQKCIERWLKDCHPKCPQCNAKARKADLRIIYAKKLATLDTTDLERALRDVDKERTSRRECEMELAKVRMQYHMVDEECTRLKSQVSSLQVQLTAYKEKSPLISSTQSTLSNSSTQSSSGTKGYFCIRSNVICQAGGCRVMDFHSRTQQFVVSQPSPHASFMTGFGVKRISAHDLKGGFFTILHQKAIKDLCFSQHTDHHLLSASLDGSLRITDLMSNAKIHEYKLGKPVWSCCWDVKDRNIMYAGLGNGTLMQFDLRNTSESLSFIENSNSKCPIVSLYHVPPSATEFFQGRGGLLTGTLEGGSFWQDIGNQENEGVSLIANFKPTILPLAPGSCTGLNYCSKPQCFLATFRPGRNYRTTTHLLCELRCQSTGGETPQVSCNVIDSYTGGQTHKLLTRNALVVPPPTNPHSTEDSVLVCVGDEAHNKVQVYDPKRSKLLQALDSDGGPALDILPANSDSTPPMLAVLSQSTFKVFQYT